MVDAKSKVLVSKSVITRREFMPPTQNIEIGSSQLFNTIRLGFLLDNRSSIGTKGRIICVKRHSVQSDKNCSEHQYKETQGIVLV